MFPTNQNMVWLWNYWSEYILILRLTTSTPSFLLHLLQPWHLRQQSKEIVITRRNLSTFVSTEYKQSWSFQKFLL